MISFKQYLAESEVNLHMSHASDLIYLEGIPGAIKSVNYLRDMRNMFGKKEKNKYSVKFDGAPAVICGIDPIDKKFFVAKKGIFNKTPKVYKTQSDIDADLSGELKDKFSILLKYLPELGISSGIYQGDLMYTHDDLKNEVIDGTSYHVFHPNTIAYAVPTNTPLGNAVQKAKLGIVFHTIYTGNSFAELKASFGHSIVNKFKKSTNVWAIDATLDDATSEFVLDDKSYFESEFLLKDIGIQLATMDKKLVSDLNGHEELRSLVLIYINSLVRTGTKGLNGKQMSEGFYKFIDDRYTKEVESKKSEKGKVATLSKKLSALEYFEIHGHDKIGKVFEFSTAIDQLKDLLLAHMREISGMKHFLKTANGFVVTNPEGFVAVNGKNAVKLVDRMEFSSANFSPKFLKGWSK